MLKFASYLQPNKVIDKNLRKTVPSLNNLFNILPNITNVYNVQKIEDEWREIVCHQFPEDLNELKKDAEAIFKYVITIEDEFNELKYQSFGQFALDVLSLPCSNADAERLFFTNII